MCLSLCVFVLHCAFFYQGSLLCVLFSHTLFFSLSFNMYFVDVLVCLCLCVFVLHCAFFN